MMRIRGSVFAVWLAVAPGVADAGYLQSSDNAGPVAGDTTTVSLTGVTAGSHLAVGCIMQSENRGIVSIADSAGSTWGQKKREPNATNGYAFEGWTTANASSGTHTLTITFDSVGQSGATCLLVEHGGVTTTPYDVDASVQTAIGDTNVTVGPTASTTQANEMVVTFAHSSNGSRPFGTPTSATATLTVQASTLSTQLAMADGTLSATAAQSANWTVTGGNSFYEAWIFTLKTGGASPPTSQFRRRVQ